MFYSVLLWRIPFGACTCLCSCEIFIAQVALRDQLEGLHEEFDTSSSLLSVLEQVRFAWFLPVDYRLRVCLLTLFYLQHYAIGGSG